MKIYQKDKEGVIFERVGFTLDELKYIGSLQQIFFAYYLVLYLYDYERYDFGTRQHLNILQEIREKIDCGVV